jgi:lysosomal acid lipase/cholesteryl ester hydrolase
VAWLTKLLPNLVANIEVPFPGFNHLDFLWGIDAPQVVYEKLLELLSNFDTRVTKD